MKKSFMYKNKKVIFILPDGTGNVVTTILKGRFYEQIFLEYIASLNISGTYLDVGANIGNHSIYFAQFTNAEKVISIEASNAIYKILKENIENNKISKKVDAHNIAAGNKAGKVSLKINNRDVVGGGSIVSGNDIVQKRLDSFKNEDIKLVKMDVEGYEIQVLEGMSYILKNHKPELFIEASTKQYFNKISEFLSEYNYRPISVFNNTATYHFSARIRRNEKMFMLYNIYVVRRILRSS